MHLKGYLLLINIISALQIVRVRSDDFSSGADYLQTAIRDIMLKNSEQKFQFINNPSMFVTASASASMSPLRRIVTSMQIDGNRRFSSREHLQANPGPSLNFVQDNEVEASASQQSQHAQQKIPQPPTLTKGELASLYEAAVSAGRIVNLSPNMQGMEDNLPLQAAVHEIKDQHLDLDSEGESYYYYFYPLKSFLNGNPAHLQKPAQVVPRDHYKSPIVTSFNTHLHNIKVEPIETVKEKGGKGIEPLFMAISSFVGMALMFMVSMIFIPRLTAGFKGGKKGGVKKNNKKARHLEESVLHSEMNWPHFISDLVSNYGSAFYQNDPLLSPYKHLLSRKSKLMAEQQK